MARNLHELWPFRLESLPDRAVGQLGVLVRFGVGDASVEQPGVQLLVARHAQPRREETLAHHPDLVLDPRFREGRLWPFSQPEAGVQAVGSTR
jgi:hypothetical protein